jgi:hypothetical protein
MVGGEEIADFLMLLKKISFERGHAYAENSYLSKNLAILRR